MIQTLKTCSILFFPVLLHCVMSSRVDNSDVINVTNPRAASPQTGTDPDQAITGELTCTSDPVSALEKWLQTPTASRSPINEQPFASTPLSKDQAQRAKELLWTDHVSRTREELSAELQKKNILAGEAKLRLKILDLRNKELVDERPSLFISMHGGGSAPKPVNDSQWRNQYAMGNGYQPRHAIYVAPRAPEDAWNMWHVPAVDAGFDRLIRAMIATENVDPNKVYLMGYSAGGDGVYQLAPRMADRFAAATMMAGHPNDVSPIGLRNLPFAIHMGEKDGAFDRNKVAAEWKTKLEKLRSDDEGGYEHVVDIHAGKGHWMDMEDKKAIPWMQGFTRNALPQKIVWRQSGVVHSRFYWLAVNPDSAVAGDEVVAERDDQNFSIKQIHGSPQIRIMLNDQLADLDKPIAVKLNGEKTFEGTVSRTIETIAKTMAERGDPELSFSAAIDVNPK